MASGTSGSEELKKHWEHLRIAEEENQCLRIDEQGKVEDELDTRWVLVGRLLSDRTVDFEALRNVMAALWCPVKGLFVKELEFNRYLFQFFHDLDISWVIEGTPWTFNNIPLILERL